jgi:hypothetical protein
MDLCWAPARFFTTEVTEGTEEIFLTADRLTAESAEVADRLTAEGAEFAEDLLFWVLGIDIASLVGSVAFSPMSVWLAPRLLLLPLVGRLAKAFPRPFSASSGCSVFRVFF